MSTTTSLALVHGREARRWLTVRAETVAVGALSFYATALVALTWGTWGDLDSDTGYDVVAATRIVDGAVPYRDFDYYYGPLAPAIGALLQLTGLSPLMASVVLGLALTTGIVGATYLIARRFVSVLGATLATAITLAVALTPNNYSFVLPHTSAATIGLLCVLVAVLLLLGNERADPSRSAVLGAGAAIGLAALSKPEPAAAAFAVGAAWLLLRRAEPSSRGLRLLVAPALAIPTAVYGVFAYIAGGHNLVFENLYPRDVLAAGGDVLLRVRMPLTLVSAVEITGQMLLYGLGCLGLAVLAAALARAGRLRIAAIALAAVAGACATAVMIARPEVLRHGLQYAYAWIPAGAVLTVVVLLVVRRRRGHVDATNELVALTGLAVLALSTYGAFYFHAPHPQMSVYAAPLAAVFLARLHLRELARGRTGVVLGAAWLAFLAIAGTSLALRDARAESVAVAGAGGSLAEAPVEARLYNDALGWIEHETRVDEPILLAPMLTGLYALSGRSSVLAEISLLPGALPSRTDEVRAIERLEAADVRFAITDDREWPGYGHTSFGRSFDLTLSDWIARNYERIAVLRAPEHETYEGLHAERTLSVWVRRER